MTVIVEELVGAAAVAANVNVLLPLPGALILVGEKVPGTPDGSPLTDKAMAELNPYAVVAVMVKGFELPAATVALAALADSVKLGAGETLRLIV